MSVSLLSWFDDPEILKFGAPAFFQPCVELMPALRYSLHCLFWRHSFCIYVQIEVDELVLNPVLESVHPKAYFVPVLTMPAVEVRES